MTHRRPRILGPVLAVMACAAGLTLGLATPTAAHEVPPNVLVQAFARPDGDRLRLVVRAPLNSMRDIALPLRGPGYLELGEDLTPLLRDAARLWIADYVEIYEDGEALGPGRITAARVSLPGDRSFEAYETALAHLNGPPPPAETELYWEQWSIDVLIEYEIESDSSDFAIHPALAHLGVRTTTVLRFLTGTGQERVYRYEGDPGLVRLDPRWYHAASRFVVLGFEHILEGIDHLLFIFCLVIPFRRMRPLIAVITAFTVAHSITLGASALGLAPTALWFPPLIETLIAASIVYMAIENIVGGVGLRRRWLMAFGFGLVHGFGFSFLLRESLQFAGSHLVTSLLAFNVGVELGQIAVVAVAVPLLGLFFRHVVRERVGTIVLSALVAHTAWHWTAETGAELALYEFAWPAFDAALLPSALNWLVIATVSLAAVWLLFGLYEKLGGAELEPERLGMLAQGRGGAEEG